MAQKSYLVQVNALIISSYCIGIGSMVGTLKQSILITYQQYANAGGDGGPFSRK